jgi:molybdopterin molybdotransferase
LLLKKSGCSKNPVVKVVTGMRSVEHAQAELLALCQPLASESISIFNCHDRVIAQDVVALRTHPPFAASAMDGYALRSDDSSDVYGVIGESAAGKRFDGSVRAGQAVRIFTGAPMPQDCDTVIVQEDVTRTGNSITVQDRPQRIDQHIRPAGLDVRSGDIIARQGTLISPALQGFFAAAGLTDILVYRQPIIELMACGDELKQPGEALGPDDIVATNALILTSLCRSAGAIVQGTDHVIADDLDAITQYVQHCRADIIVTIGGASVGERDFVQAALRGAGCDITFWKIALKPGKPMMVGTRGKQIIIGLPGNPVSAYVCALLFLLPAIRALQGLLLPLPQPHMGIAATDLKPGGDRTEYQRAALHLRDGQAWLTPHIVQDSAMLSVLAASEALIIRSAGAPAAASGAAIKWLNLKT